MFDSLKAMVEGTSLVNIRDRWIWSLQSSGDFTVASIRKLIDEFTLSEVSSSTRWIKAVPIKVNVLAWKIKLDNLPSRLNISRRGMDIDSILCWKRIIKKRTKTKLKTDKTEHGIEKCEKTKSTGKSTSTKSKVNQVKKIQLEGLKLPKLKLYYKNKKTRAEIANWVK
ncbi:hypothetical protein Tco_0227509 [Tanacetum coccineum]